MSITPKEMNETEEEFVKRLQNDGFHEVDIPLYPFEGNLFYDGLNRPDLIECYRTFTNDEKSVVYSVVSFGKKMCGHKGILHGGASGSTLDQFFGLMIRLLDIKGFTGQLHLNYKKIILCPSTVLIKGTYDRAENRKHYFKATIYDEIDDVCVESECLFIQSDIDKILKRALDKLEKDK